MREKRAIKFELRYGVEDILFEITRDRQIFYRGARANRPDRHIGTLEAVQTLGGTREIMWSVSGTWETFGTPPPARFGHYRSRLGAGRWLAKEYVKRLGEQSEARATLEGD